MKHKYRPFFIAGIVCVSFPILLFLILGTDIPMIFLGTFLLGLFLLIFAFSGSSAEKKESKRIHDAKLSAYESYLSQFEVIVMVFTVLRHGRRSFSHLFLTAALKESILSSLVFADLNLSYLGRAYNSNDLFSRAGNAADKFSADSPYDFSVFVPFFIHEMQFFSMLKYGKPSVEYSALLDCSFEFKHIFVKVFHEIDDQNIDVIKRELQRRNYNAYLSLMDHKRELDNY